jgi:PAS domain S-box-containing protein
MTAGALSPNPRNLALQHQPDDPHQAEHLVYFYQDSDPLLEALCDFVGPVLDAGSGAVIVASKAHRDGLQERLTARGLDLRRAGREGRYVALDAAETLSKFMVDGMPDGARFDEIVGGFIGRTTDRVKGAHPEIAVFGEMVSLLATAGKIEAAIRLEQLWNELAKKYSFSLRCAYPMANFHGEKNVPPLIRICAEHTAVVIDEGDRSFTGGHAKVALYQSEERFRMLVDAVQDYAIFTLDTAGYITSWNTGAERIKGYAVSEILGKHFSVFYPEEDIRAGKPQHGLEVAAREGRSQDEGWRLRKDGSRFLASVVIAPLRDHAGKLVGFGKVTRDITEKMQTNEALRKEIAERTEAQQKLSDSEKSLRQLSLRLLQTQEEERRRIGRDLHDSVGQFLVGLKMKLDSFKSLAKRDRPEDASQLAECSQLTEEAIKEVRTISYLLYPPMLEELGLKSAIPWYVEGFAKRSGIKTSFELSPDFSRIPSDLELALFRVLQECLTNVHRHSGSPTANVRLLMKNRTATLEITDQGKGIQLKNGRDGAEAWMCAYGVGLRGMSERMRQWGGSLEISSAPGKTVVTATIPVPETASAGAEQAAGQD